MMNACPIIHGWLWQQLLFTRYDDATLYKAPHKTVVLPPILFFFAFMKSICVYCGSSAGVSDYYTKQVKLLAKELVDHKITLVYGGGNVGLMGTIASEVLRLGGEVTGVIPELLVQKEVAYNGLTQRFIVKDMHERKAMMAKLADGFIAMPGGLGTLEEVAEIMTWAQIGIHQKPVAFYNVNGFYDKLFAFFHHAIEEGFTKPAQIDQIINKDDPKALIDAMLAYQPLFTGKWTEKKSA